MKVELHLRQKNIPINSKPFSTIQTFVLILLLKVTFLMKLQKIKIFQLLQQQKQEVQIPSTFPGDGSREWVCQEIMVFG